jgi:hypothetical protein
MSEVKGTERIFEAVRLTERTFTTEPKLRRILWHKQTTVKTRATALQESFYPDVEVTYEAARTRMANLLGIVDRASVLAYLGRPAYESKVEMEQTVTYRKSGSQVPKRHRFYRKFAARKGYIESFNLGYSYRVKDEWFVHWNHVEQLTLEPANQLQGYEASSREQPSKVDFSLSSNGSVRMEQQRLKERETEEEGGGYSQRERNSETESNLRQTVFVTDDRLDPARTAAVEERDRKRLEILNRTLLQQLENSVKDTGGSERG